MATLTIDTDEGFSGIQNELEKMSATELHELRKIGANLEMAALDRITQP